MSFDLDIYLERIGIERPGPDPDGLARLQETQLRGLVFENIDPFLGRIPDLSPQAQWDKLILARRGGYCFELNGMFARALSALGFEFRPILARVLQRAPDSARTHLAFVVTIDGEEWLADTGFGGPGALRPLRIEPDLVQSDPRGRYRFKSVDGEHLLEREEEGRWLPLFQFDRARVSPLDIEAANVVCATWKMAPFPNNLMMARHAPDRRVSLFNRHMKIEMGGAVEERTITDHAMLEEVLRGEFALQLEGAMIDAVWEKLSR
jgi:N-hydroxyarylamine O-acetyltransferase